MRLGGPDDFVSIVAMYQTTAEREVSDEERKLTLAPTGERYVQIAKEVLA